MSSIIRNAIKLIILIIAFIWVIYYARKNRCHKGIVISTALLFAWEVFNTACWLVLHCFAEFVTPSDVIFKIKDVLSFAEYYKEIPINILLIVVLVVMIKQRKAVEAQKTENG